MQKVLLKICMKKMNFRLRMKWTSEREMGDSVACFVVLLQDKRPNGRLIRNLLGLIEGGRFPCADYTDSDVIMI